MPLTKLICHCRKCDGKVAQPVQVALDHAAKRDGRYHFELLSAMVATVQNRDYISTTTLASGKCLRSERLKRELDYTDDPKKLYAAFRGTMFHGQLEHHAHPNVVAEARFFVYLDAFGQWLSGSPDVCDVKRGYIGDYKFTGKVPVFDYAWGDHKEQGQVNRWLVDHCDYYTLADGTSHACTDRGAMHLHGELQSPEVYRENAARVRPVDWQGVIVLYMDNDTVKPILVTKSIDVPQKSDPKKTRKARVADIWDDDRVFEHIIARFGEADAGLNGDGIPDIPDDYKSWKHPLCGYCPVKDACVDLYIESEVSARITQRSAS